MSSATAHRVVERSSAGSAGRPSRLRTRLRSIAPVVLTPVVLVVVLFLGVASPFIGVALLLVVAGVILLAARGFEQSALVLLTGAFFMAPMDRVRPIPAVAFVSVADLLFFLGFATLGVALLGLRVHPRAPYVAGAAAVMGAGLLVCLASDNPGSSLAIMIRLLVGAVLLPLVLMLWAPGIGVLRILAGAFVAGNVVNVVYGVTLGVRNFEGRIIGYSEHPNVLGLAALLALALCPFLMQRARPQDRWIWAVAAFLCLYGIWASGSRAALLVAGVVGLLYPVLARSIRIGLALTGAGIVALYFIGNALLSGESSSNILGRFVGNGSASASDIAREDAARVAFGQFEQRPFLGNGLSEGTLDAHNVYLQIAAAGGVVLLIAFLVLLFAVLRQPFALGPSYRLLALPALAYVMIAPITSLIWDRYIWCALALPFLIVVADRRSGADETRSAAAPEHVDA